MELPDQIHQMEQHKYALIYQINIFSEIVSYWQRFSWNWQLVARVDDMNGFWIDRISRFNGSSSDWVGFPSQDAFNFCFTCAYEWIKSIIHCSIHLNTVDCMKHHKTVQYVTFARTFFLRKPFLFVIVNLQADRKRLKVKKKKKISRRTKKPVYIC